MPVIGPCTYDDDMNIIIPDKSEIRHAKYSMSMLLEDDSGERARNAFTPGYTYVLSLKSMAWEPSEAVHRAQRQLQRFLSEAQFREGFCKLALHTHKGTSGQTTGNILYHVDQDLIYAVEPRASQRRPLSASAAAPRRTARPAQATTTPGSQTTGSVPDWRTLLKY